MVKLAWIISMIFALEVAASSEKSYSQQTKINIKVENENLEGVIWQIKRKTEFSFFYYNDDIASVKGISINLKNATVEEILSEALANTDLSYQIVNKAIIINKAAKKEVVREKAPPAAEAPLQEIIVKGRVTDESGDPLPAVSIVEKGTTNGTVTNLNGEYSIKVASPASILRYSFVGFLTVEEEVGNRRAIDVVLMEDVQSLDEVVVVGYGSQRKASVTASISSISRDEIIEAPSANLAVGLSGKLPGLTIMQRTGELGAEQLDITLRGLGTLNNNEPLVLVDGVERSITTLDPHEIESISILKDASATAVFGVRGANGVILVNTKRGEVGKPKITITAEHAFQSFVREPDIVSAYDYARLTNEALTNDGQPIKFQDHELESYRLADSLQYYPVRDFYNEFIKDYTPMSRINVNVGGGTQKVKYYTTLGLVTQEGPFKIENDKFDEYDYDAQARYKRINFRANVDMNINKSLRGWMNLSGYFGEKQDPGIYTRMDIEATRYHRLLEFLLSQPNLAYYGNLTPSGEVIGNSEYLNGDINVYGYLNRTGYYKETNNRINSTVGFEQKLDFLTKGLSANLIVSYDSYGFNGVSWYRSFAQYEAIRQGDTFEYVKYVGDNTPLASRLANSFQTNFELNASLNYNRTFGSLHDVTGLLLFLRNQNINNIQIPYNYIGFVGRATYGYSNRYLAEINFGYNGSEQFPPESQFGFFPSYSVGWVISEEDFMKSVSFVNFLKLRASYGKVGNDKMGGARFLYLGDWNFSPGGWPTLGRRTYEGRMENRNITWEVSEKSNIGIEARFLNQFRLNLELFYEKRDNILRTDPGNVPIFLMGHVDVPPSNYGKVENKGFELIVDYYKDISKNWFFSGQISTSFARNKILYLREVERDETYAHQYRSTGYRIGELWGYKTDGFFNTQDEIDAWADQSSLFGPVRPGDLKFVDMTGDGVVNEKDEVPLAHPQIPEWTISGSGVVRYKNFSLSFLLQGITNYGVVLDGYTIKEITYQHNQYSEWHKEAWTQEKYENGEKISYPRLSTTSNGNYNNRNDFWIRDTKVLRLKNAQFTYTIPGKVTEKLGIETMKVYVNGTNLFTWDNLPIKYFDPEQYNNLTYPPLKTYNFGLNLTF